MLGLSEPPHFLVPGYTATLDYWIDPKTQKPVTLAEIHPLVHRHQSLLNAVFEINDLSWKITPWQEESCNPILLETYQSQFPQLWLDHNLILRLDPETLTSKNLTLPQSVSSNSGYVLRLFVSDHSATTQQTLKSLHEILEQTLCATYTLKVIDIFKHPEQVELNQVSATPTLVRVWPLPVKRIVGVLEDFEQVVQIIMN